MNTDLTFFAADICRTCAEDGTCCCAIDPAFASLSFPLSEAEWARIESYINIAEPDPLSFMEKKQYGRTRENNAPEFIQAMENLFMYDVMKVRQLFPPGGFHYRLSTTAQGLCVFLGEGGCYLPRQARPWYCLLFPHWVQGKELTLFLSETCLISRQVQSVGQSLRMLQIHQEEVMAQYSQLRAEWGLDSAAAI